MNHQGGKREQPRNTVKPEHVTTPPAEPSLTDLCRILTQNQDLTHQRAVDRLRRNPEQALRIMETCQLQVRYPGSPRGAGMVRGIDGRVWDAWHRFVQEPGEWSPQLPTYRATPPPSPPRARDGEEQVERARSRSRSPETRQS